MVDGAAHLSSFLFGFFRAGLWSKERGTNLLDTGAPFYDTYATADGEFMAVGAIEPQFYARLLEGLGLDADALPHQMDRTRWEEVRELFTKTFGSKTRAEWSAVFDGSDACVAPILGLDEAADHPANVARNVFVEGIGGHPMPAPAPRLSRTPGHGATTAPVPGTDTNAVLAEAGLSAERIEELRRSGAVG